MNTIEIKDIINRFETIKNDFDVEDKNINDVILDCDKDVAKKQR